MAVQKSDLRIRNATPQDFGSIRMLLRSIGLPTAGVRDHLENFVVLLSNENIIGTAGLELYGKSALLRSLAVRRKYQEKGYGHQLYQAIMNEAEKKGINTVYLLTETAEYYFARRGFEKVSREEVSEKVKSSMEFSCACPDSAICMRRTI